MMLLRSQTDTATPAPARMKKKRRRTISPLKDLEKTRVVNCVPLRTLCDSSGTARILDYQSPSQERCIGGLGSQSRQEPACEGSIALHLTMTSKEYEVEEDTSGESKVIPPFFL